ncbi:MULTISPECIES: hypothetical protein [unclassified Ensifer]|uniref:phage tail fiber protein n=1 Tax=unclassified Ensifer TaxID=2633371 RepID=UPI000812F6FD|nr:MULTISPECIES: hypothetical protein [unclassified Ensifer]OCP21881.1 hypothetical protein BC361_25265 [Ensifer sp. LC54]OCP23339.1 hypothetical protein BC363_25500 [Ensifer sp. LC384]
MDKILIEAGDVQVEFPTVTEILQVESDQGVIEIYSGDDVGVELVASAVGPKGDKGDTGDVTPELNQAKLDAQAAAADANASRGIAVASAGVATTKAGEASTSATSANASKIAAATSETNANTSKNAAAASAAAALASENSAKTSETNAKASETNAATSEANALAYRNTASTHATTATTKAGEAAASQTAAAGSETAASGSAAGALASKNAAAISAQEALDHRNAAQSSATAAGAAEVAAVTAKTAAETAQTAAQNAKTGADAARDAAAMAEAGAQTAQAITEAARDVAILARDDAETAKTGSETARDAAQAWAAAAAASAAEADQFEPGNYVLKAANGADFADPALVRTNIGAQVALQTIDRVEAEAGASTTERNWTAERVRQAVAAYAPAIVHGHIIADVAGLQAALNEKASLVSPALTGAPTTPTPAAGDRSTKIANTEYVRTALDEMIGAAPGTLNTLQEIADALGDDPNFAATITQSLAGKADLAHTHVAADITDLAALLNAKASLASPALTGNPTATTQAAADNSTRLATTAHVKAAIAASGLATEGHTHAIADVSGLQAALDAKASLASPALTGTPTAPTAALYTSTAQIATTAFVQNGLNTKAAATHLHAIGDTTGLQAALNSKMNAAGGVFTGSVAVVNSTGSNGYLQLVAGSLARPGFVEFRKNDDLRAGYVGWGNGTNTIDIFAEAGYSYTFNVTPTVGANVVWHAGNDGPGTGLSADLLDDLDSTQFLRSDTAAGNNNVLLASGQGNGVRFWNGDAAYSVYMSSQADATYGGRLDGASDYNMYFRMGNGAGRGFVFKNGTTNVAQVTGAGEIMSVSANNYRIKYGNYGQFWRFDGGTLYLMFTASGDQAGGYNALRPFMVNAASGTVSMGHGLSVTGNVSASGTVYAGASGRLAGDGNVFGTLWGGTGDWLSNYLNNQFANKVSVGGRAYPIRVGGVDLNFNWSGQAGQPSWLWGGNDGTNMYVYNPSNFNVNWANGAGNADTVDGYHAIDLSQIYKGTNASETNLPIGTYVTCYGVTGILHQTYVIRLAGPTAAHYVNDGWGSGAVLAGTWRHRGYVSWDGSYQTALYQRVA